MTLTRRLVLALTLSFTGLAVWAQTEGQVQPEDASTVGVSLPNYEYLERITNLSLIHI